MRAAQHRPAQRRRFPARARSAAPHRTAQLHPGACTGWRVGQRPLHGSASMACTQHLGRGCSTCSAAVLNVAPTIHPRRFLHTGHKVVSARCPLLLLLGRRAAPCHGGLHRHAALCLRGRALMWRTACPSWALPGGRSRMAHCTHALWAGKDARNAPRCCAGAGACRGYAYAVTLGPPRPPRHACQRACALIGLWTHMAPTALPPSLPLVLACTQRTKAPCIKHPGHACSTVKLMQVAAHACMRAAAAWPGSCRGVMQRCCSAPSPRGHMCVWGGCSLQCRHGLPGRRHERTHTRACCRALPTWDQVIDTAAACNPLLLCMHQAGQLINPPASGQCCLHGGAFFKGVLARHVRTEPGAVPCYL